MALPPFTTNSLLNLPAPISPGTLLATPVAIPQQQAVNFNTAGKPGYAAAYQPGSPYSATNLPEFMKDYQQTPSGKFVMNQGILGMPPQIDKVQSLFSQGYAQEYQPLEQKFQESFAFDPSMFGNIYRSGQLIPGMTPPDFGQPEPINPAAAIAGAVAIKEAYPYAEDFVKGLIPDSVPQPEPQGPPEQTFAQKFEEKVTQPVKAATIDPIVAGWQESDLKKNIDQAYTAQKEFVRDKGLRDIETSVKNFISAADEKFDKPEWLNSLQEKVLPSGKTAFELYGNIENFAKDPTPQSVFKVTDSIQELNTFLPEDMQIKLPGGIVGGIADISAGLAVAEALKKPTVENLTQAYVAADHIAQNYSDTLGVDGLPGAQAVGTVGGILAGVKAAEGGIDSPGEAIAVANAAALATQAATKAYIGSSATAAAANAAAATANSWLGPIGWAITAEAILSEDMSVKDILQGMPITGRLFGGGGATFGTATLGYDGNDFGFVKESSKKGGWQYTMPEMHATNLVLNELTDNLGFELDQNKLKGISTTIDIDNGNVNRGANDIVIEMIEKGAIKPTANTPNNIDWGNLFTEARKYSSGYTEQKTPGVSISDIKALQANPSLAASQAYKTTIPVKTQVGKGYSTTQVPGIISKTGKEVRSKELTDASYAKFANQDDAFAFAEDPGNIKKTVIPGKINPKNRKKEPDTVEVTYFEVQKDNSLRQKTKTMSPAAAQSFAVSKPAPAPTYGSPMDFGLPNINFAGIDLSGIDWGKINLTI
jgi:hypothetical protein